MTRPVTAPRTRRGMTLGLVIGMAIVFSMAAYAVLYMSTSLRQRAGFQERNLRARYAAEAGMVWAMQQLWNNPNWTEPVVGGGDVDLVVDTSGDGLQDPNDPKDTKVDVYYPAVCAGPDPCTLEVRVDNY